jgi:hypothetical protein
MKPVANSNPQAISCPCSQSKAHISSQPITRFVCHCSICQSLYKKPADFVVIHAKHVTLDKTDQLDFAKYRLPPALNRGVCAECHTPVIGFLRLAPFLKLAFIPAERFSDLTNLPEIQAHIFYHSRTKDINDENVKISGYWKSEWAVTQAVLRGLMRT